MQGYKISFCIYAETEEEAEEARAAVVDFINAHARQGRAVTGEKIATAMRNWDKNPIVRNHIINFLTN